jgi:hypothetical protein
VDDARLAGCQRAISCRRRIYSQLNSLTIWHP